MHDPILKKHSSNQCHSVPSLTFIHSQKLLTVHCTVTCLPGDIDLSIKIETSRKVSMNFHGSSQNPEHHSGFSLKMVLCSLSTQDWACSWRIFYFRAWTFNTCQLHKLSNPGNSEAVEPVTPSDFCLLKPLAFRKILVFASTAQGWTQLAVCVLLQNTKKKV